MKELKKCPFCGGEVKIHSEQVDARTVLDNFVCGKCCANTYFDFTDREEAIEQWNNRLTEAEIRAKAIDEFSSLLVARFERSIDGDETCISRLKGIESRKKIRYWEARVETHKKAIEKVQRTAEQMKERE